MQRGDFDVSSLASYLHITPSQVVKMVERGNLPGRKVGGQWRFSPAEIHHWLEQKIGVSDEDELIAVERILEDRAPSPAELRLDDLLSPDTIAAPLMARTRTSVISTMCELAARSGRLWDANAMAEAVKAREALHPTALDCGVALLHPRRPQSSLLAQAVVAVGIAPHGIHFGGITPTTIFFLLAATSDAEHLLLLARVSRLLGIRGLLDSLREASSPDEVYRMLVAADLELRNEGTV